MKNLTLGKVLPFLILFILLVLILLYFYLKGQGT